MRPTTGQNSELACRRQVLPDLFHCFPLLKKFNVNFFYFLCVHQETLWFMSPLLSFFGELEEVKVNPENVVVLGHPG